MGSSQGMEDGPYREWISEAVALPVRAPTMLICGADDLWVAGPGYCGRLGDLTAGETAAPDPLLDGGVRALVSGPGVLWGALAGGLGWRVDGDWQLVWDSFRADEGGILALTATRDALWMGLSGGALYRRALALGDRTPPELVWRSPGAIRCLGRGEHGLLVGGDAGLWALNGEPGGRQLTDLPVRCMRRWRGHWLTGTSDGLLGWRQDGEAWDLPELAHPPVRDIWHLAAGPAGALWVGSARGLARLDAEGWHSLQGPRWLSADPVWALAAFGGQLFAATPSGVVRVRAARRTLRGKASVLEERLERRHLRLTGFVSEARLAGPGNVRQSRPFPSDNDGLWTALYLAAASYRAAATGSRAAAARAHRSFAAMEWLERVTGISGFPAKAILPQEEAPDTEEWRPSPDGRWVWKLNCSSDEIIGHLYGYSLYYDLVADASAQRRVAALVGRILDHILDHGLQLVAFGRRTEWGFWDPETLNGPTCRWGDRGLNSLAILSHLRVAEHITGDPKYGEVYTRLVLEHGYAENTLFTRVDLPGHLNHSDDELAFLAFEPLLRYETDPDLRAIYLRALDRLMAKERVERNPLWTFIYDAGFGASMDVDVALRSLREIPTDQVMWPVRNSQRADVRLDPLTDENGRLQLDRVLPYNELALVRWNENPFVGDAGDSGVEGDGVWFLLPYWMGRYHGWIVPPARAQRPLARRPGEMWGRVRPV